MLCNFRAFLLDLEDQVWPCLFLHEELDQERIPLPFTALANKGQKIVEEIDKRKKRSGFGMTIGGASEPRRKNE